VGGAPPLFFAASSAACWVRNFASSAAIFSSLMPAVARLAVSSTNRPISISGAANVET